MLLWCTPPPPLSLSSCRQFCQVASHSLRPRIARTSTWLESSQLNTLPESASLRRALKPGSEAATAVVLLAMTAMTTMTTTTTTTMMTAKQQNQPPVEAAIHWCHLERLLSAALQAERGSRPGWRRLQPWPRSRIRDGRVKRGACAGRHPLRRGPSRAIDVLSFAGNQFDRDCQQRRLRTIWEDDASGDQWRRWTALPPTSSATHKAAAEASTRGLKSCRRRLRWTGLAELREGDLASEQVLPCGMGVAWLCMT